MTTKQSEASFSSQCSKLGGAMAMYGVEPAQMEASFPNLLRAIDAGWGADDCLHYIDSLLFSTRPNRHGFPNEVIDELLLIKNIYEITFPNIALGRSDPTSKANLEANQKRIEELTSSLKLRTKKHADTEAPEPEKTKTKKDEVSTLGELQEALNQFEKGPLLGRSERRLIGEYLMQAEVIGKDSLSRALNYQAKAPERRLIGKLLVAENSIKQHDLHRALCLQRGIPVVDVSSIALSPEATRLVPIRIARMKNALPITMFNHHLVVAVANPFDPELLEYFSFLSCTRALLVFATPDRIASALLGYGQAQAGETQPAHHRSHQKTPVAEVEDGKPSRSLATNSGQQTEADDFGEEAEDPIDAPDIPAAAGIDENDETVIGLVNKTINDAVRVGASDIHFEAFPRCRNARIRFRKDGLMEAHAEYPISYHPAIVSRIKIMSDLDISEKRKAQDGKIAFGQDNRKLDLRVSTIPTCDGLEGVTLRILNSSKPLPLSRIGMHPGTRDAFREQILKPYGLILVCGPTGSGKTTTLHSVLRELNTPERKIWTAEDPVEIVQKNISQVQVLPKIGWTFAIALRSFLRADPDVIMVGEIRDAETAKVAVEASMTGHLVLATLHTNSAAETLGRMLDLGVQAFNLADAAQAILAQRLARRICPDCGEKFEFSAEELDTLVGEYFLAGTGKTPARAEREKLLGRWRAEFFSDGALVGRRVVGCSACNGTGYRDRLGIHELLLVTPELRRLIRSAASTGEIFRQAISDGMKTLRQDGIEKVVQGLTDLKEVRTVCL
jgi:type II secretory ATPase GspE/PulE/Tfp pilus assembly ATPase PilB-like protein